MPRSNPWFTFLLLAGFVLLIPSLTSLAADPPSAEAAPSSAEAKKPPETLLELIVAGGLLNILFMSILAVCSLAAVAVVIERFVNLTQRKLMPAEFVSELQERIASKEDNPEPLLDLCKRYPSPAASVLRAGLLRAGRPLPEVEKAMEDAAARETGELRNRARPLTVLGNVAPLLGLLGTVVGMILAFRTASQAGLGKAELLAEGIYLALETTVAGLVIAIPCQLFSAWFQSRTDRHMRRMDEVLSETMPCFDLMEKARSEQPLGTER